MLSAAACQMTVLAADQLGFGGVWYSTDAAELSGMRELLGLSPDHSSVGFMVFGTPAEKRQKKRPCVSGYTQIRNTPGKIS